MSTTAQETTIGGGVLNGLAALLHPMSESEFFEEYYGRKPFITTERPVQDPLVRIDDVVAQVQCLQLEYGAGYTLARDGKLLPDIFHRSLRKKQNGLSDLLKEGWTLGFNGISSGLYPLHALGSQLNEDLKWDVNVNTYHTPASSQGYAYHCDHHDVFVWQQTGRKHWKVYAQGDCEGKGELVIDTVLEPGQVLYMPENCRHAGFACDDADSLHLTIGFLSRYSQVKKQLQKRLETWIEDDMAGGLDAIAMPRDFTEWPAWVSKQELLVAMDGFREHLTAEMEADDDYRAEFSFDINRIQSPLSPDEVVHNMLTMSGDSVFTVLEPGHTELREDRSGVDFRFSSGELAFREEFHAALDTLKEPKTLRASDLPLEPQDAAALCRLLVGAAVLRPEAA